MNAKPRWMPGPQLLHHLIGQHSVDQQHAIEFATADGGTQHVSYEQLHARSATLAFRLSTYRNQSSEPAAKRFIIPLYIPQSLELYVSQLAVLKVGGAFCPISTDVPEDRLRFILGDTEARVLLTTSNVAKQLPSVDGVEVIVVDDRQDSQPSSVGPFNVRPSDAAYIM